MLDWAGRRGLEGGKVDAKGVGMEVGAGGRSVEGEVLVAWR